MKALTVIQPWAHLIAFGGKRIENRRWYTSYRGPLAIHAGKNKKWCSARDYQKWPDMEFGKVIVIADLVNCFPFSKCPLIHPPKGFEWIMDDEFAEGPFCWILDNVKVLRKPIFAGGKQGLWNINVEGNDLETRRVRIGDSSQHRKAQAH